MLGSKSNQPFGRANGLCWSGAGCCDDETENLNTDVLVWFPTKGVVECIPNGLGCLPLDTMPRGARMDGTGDDVPEAKSETDRFDGPVDGVVSLRLVNCFNV